VSLAKSIGLGPFRRTRQAERAHDDLPNLVLSDPAGDDGADGQPRTAFRIAPRQRPVVADGWDLDDDAPVVTTTRAARTELETAMPRWRRPSLQEARHAEPSRTLREHQPLQFGDAGTGSSSADRRVVRYRLVRMLTVPDELHGLETGCLDEGDQVEVVEQHGAYRFVVAPDGSAGWVHKMTLGDLVEATAPGIVPLR
jgi:hypothetical protein